MITNSHFGLAFIFLVVSHAIVFTAAQSSPFSLDTAYVYQENHEEYEAIRERARVNVEKLLNKTAPPCDNEQLNTCIAEKERIS